jgi:hypothetical protein
MRLDEHLKNRARVPREELLKYAGMQVAWSADGLRILEGDEDLAKLLERLRIAGYTSADFVVSYVDRADEWALCGGLLDGEDEGE